MKYIALVYYAEEDLKSLSQEKWDAMNRECISCAESLHSAGHLHDGAPLQPVSTATTLRVRDDKVMLSDGPFAETKEQLAGFYLLEARDLNEALSLAAKIPPAKYGSIEVRPVRELREQDNQHYA